MTQTLVRASHPLLFLRTTVTEMEMEMEVEVAVETEITQDLRRKSQRKKRTVNNPPSQGRFRRCDDRALLASVCYLMRIS